MKGPLSLTEWRYTGDRPTEAKLAASDGSTVYIAPRALLGAPEYLSRLSEADRQAVADMVLKGGADA